MKRFASAWRGWVAFTSEKESPTVLAIFRILIGLCAIGSLWSAARAGVVDAFWISASDGGAMRLTATRLIKLFGGPTHDVVWTFFAVAMASAALVTVGLGGRWPALVASQSYAALTDLNGNTAGGYDAMIAIAFFILFFSRASTAFSVDAWRNLESPWADAPEVPAWPRYVLIFQMIVIYFMTGLQKASPVWTPVGGYTALYWVYQDPTWRRFDSELFVRGHRLLQVATAVTWHWETAAPMVLVWYWARRTKDRAGRIRKRLLAWDLRKIYLAVGVCLHLGILLTLDVGPFSLVSLSFYPLFFTPDEVEGFFERVRRIRSRASAA
ncbi:MAG: HTTM domain-containing protein [Polyangiaceae bacterium]|nr:HTTM domain-containing protein [Polyangiaceae bacterium]